MHGGLSPDLRTLDQVGPCHDNFWLFCCPSLSSDFAGAAHCTKSYDRPRTQANGHCQSADPAIKAIVLLSEGSSCRDWRIIHGFRIMGKIE